MVVAASTTPNLKTTPNLRSQSNPKRPPLLPSERDNNVAVAAHHRRQSRVVNSRYLSTSSSSSTSGSSSSTFSNSSYFSSSYRRCPSPIRSRTTPAAAPASPAMNSAAVKRSQSAERRRPATPRPRGERIPGEMTAAAKLLVSSSRSLSVSFQGESFAVPTSKKTTKPSQSPSQTPSLSKGTPESKRNSSTTMTPKQGGEDARPIEYHQPWPGRSRSSVTSLSRSVDLGCEGKKLINGSAAKVARALQDSLISDHKLHRSMSRDVVKGVREGGDANCVNTSSLRSESRVSDGESVSSECNSGSQDSESSVGRSKREGRSFVVPARFWKETNSNMLKPALEPGSPSCRVNPLKGAMPPKLIAPKRFLTDSPVASPRGTVNNRGFSSPVRGSVRPASPSNLGTSVRPASPSKLGTSVRPASPSKLGTSVRPASPSKLVTSVRPSSPSNVGTSVRPASPSKLGTSVRPASPGKVGTLLRPASPSKLGTSLECEKPSPSRGIGRMASPSKLRNGIGGAFANSVGSTPSVLCFGADVRRVKVGDGRLGDAHLLRILHNRHLQWRFVNARAEASLSIQKFNAERSLYSAWKTTSDLHAAVSSKRKELQWLRQKLKLVSILKGQMLYLEEWALMDKDHCSSLSGAIESLKASTIRLPLVGGARADIQDVKDAICSAADVMHAMASSICSLLGKVEEVNSLVAEVASINTEEHFSLKECKDILSVLAAMQVKDCSLRAHILQLKCAPSSLAVEV